MKLACIIVALLFSGLYSSVVSAQSIDWTKHNVKLVKIHIIPRYKKLARVTSSFAKNAETECLSSNHKQLRKQFKQVQLAWAGIQHIRFGPIEFLQRYERFNYWPDKHSVAAKQIRKLLGSDLDNLTVKNLSKKSIAVQGVSTIERLLYEPTSKISKKEAVDAKCKLVKLIANNLNDIASSVDKAWRLPPVSYAQEFVLAEHGEGSYSSSPEIIHKLQNSLNTQLLSITMQKLNNALPNNAAKKIRPRRFEAWQSEMSLPIIKKNIQAVKRLYVIGFSKEVKKLNKPLHRSIKNQFKTINKAIKKVKKPLFDVNKDVELAAQVRELSKLITHLRHSIGDDMHKTLGFTQSFNSLDGD